MSRRWLLPVVGAAGAFVAYLLGAGYQWQLALLTATAIGALVYSAQVTWTRMNRLLRGPDRGEEPEEGS
ncbi:MAG: hypothetical protein GY719_04555 [bacterium]|nr:hypothetical protein [bacterium]